MSDVCYVCDRIVDNFVPGRKICRACQCNRVRQSYRKNKRRYLEAAERWRRANRASVNAATSARHKRDPRRRILMNAKRRASQDGLPFNIDIDDVVVPDLCPALGIPLAVGPGKIHASSPSLDKIVPSLGYVKGNVVVVSMLANRIKTNATSEQVAAVAKWMQTLVPNGVDVPVASEGPAH